MILNGSDGCNSKWCNIDTDKDANDSMISTEELYKWMNVQMNNEVGWLIDVSNDGCTLVEYEWWFWNNWLEEKQHGLK